ncbi:MAG: prenyltransferase [bacterium]|nr:prenyltransferase [bacterium]
MAQNPATIMECSRVFALPTTLFSWLVIFVYSWINFGNILFGIVALFGMIFAHLGTNLLDDYFDYKSLIKSVNFDKAEYLKNSQKTKCRYLVNGVMKESDVLLLIAIYYGLALLIGGFLWFKCGNGVFYYTLIACVVLILYPFISRICLSEVAVAVAYGPILFGGMFYVMTGTCSNEVFWLMLPSTIMTVVLLYIHTLMDYGFDTNEGKCTLANRFDSQLDALVVLKILLILAYVSVVLLCILDIFDWQVLLVFLTIPLSCDLYKSLKVFSCNPAERPVHKWYHYPMEHMKYFEDRDEDSFMIRIYQARNLMMYFSLIFVIGIYLSLAI